MVKLVSKLRHTEFHSFVEVLDIFNHIPRKYASSRFQQTGDEHNMQHEFSTGLLQVAQLEYNT